jgi:carbon storage regulator
MLILQRRKEESVVVDGRIVVRVLGIEDNHVILGFDAEDDVKIWRLEIFERRVSMKMDEPKSDVVRKHLANAKKKGEDFSGA